MACARERADREAVDDVDDERGVSPPPEETIIPSSESAPCVKCAVQPGKYAGRKFWMCGDCLVDSVEVPVYRGICAAKCNDIKLSGMLCYSGGAASRFTLHTIRRYIKGEKKKRLTLTLRLVWVEEGAALGWAREKCDMVRATISDQLERCGFEYGMVPLLCITSGLSDPRPAAGCGCEACTSLRVVGKSTHQSQSVRSELLRRARETTITHAARVARCTYAILCTHATQLATEIIAGVAMGRGGGLHMRTGVSYRLGDVGDACNELLWIQPVREVLPDEMLMAMEHMKIDQSGDVGGTQLEFGQNNVTSLANEFVCNLQRDKPHIVHTLLRSIEKLADRKEDSRTCKFCLCPYEPGIGARGDRSGASLCCACAGLPREVVFPFLSEEDKAAVLREEEEQRVMRPGGGGGGGAGDNGEKERAAQEEAKRLVTVAAAVVGAQKLDW